MAGLDTSPAPAPSHPTSEGPLSTPQVALVGNPNTGKTSLFNALTGLRAKTANFPGSTVDIRRGRLDLESGPAELIDLPGLYSLDALSPEEAVAASVLRGEAGTESAPDAVLVVIDATHIERNLYLASEVVDLQLPTIVALNMIDAASAARITIEVERLSSHLGCPVVAVSSRTGSGLAEVRQAVDSQLAAVEPQQDHVSCTAGCTGCHFAARYDWAEQVATECVETPDGQGHRTAAIDRVLVNPFGGMIAFLAVMVGIFYLIFSLADVPMTMVDEGFAVVAATVDAAFPSTDMHPAAWFVAAASLSMAVFWLAYRAAGIRWSAKSGASAAVVSVVVGLMPADDLNSLLVDGVIAGVGGVVIFLPQICILFFFISLLEQSGYLARGAFVMERLMRLVGLPGKAFVPMISAHACAIPGIMAARVIEDWRDRLVTILVLP
ncbi:MAG TPA: ferrous iron transport protein B, partial [Planctomycetaceae bacterium]|nr:ferrous iron transport protein B [Planctomycetaceae bacterium]